MIGKLPSFVIGCILITHMQDVECMTTTNKNKQKVVSLSQIYGKMSDGWDDSFVSEQIIDHDNSQAKQREAKEDEDQNSAENIEKNFA